MRILVLSSQASNTGSTLRAEYVYKYLLKNKVDADYIRPPLKSMPLMLDFLLTLFYNTFVLMNRKYDYVFIVKPYPNTVWPAKMLKMKGAKIVIDIDDMDYGYRSGWMSGIIKKLQHRLVKNAEFITSHNDELIRLIKKEHPEYKDRVYKLNQCVDTEIFSVKSVNRKAAAKIRKVYKNKKILFYMAHLNIASYLEHIFDALVGLKSEYVLLIAGGGPMESFYKTLSVKNGLRDNVVFLGQMKQQEIVNYIYAADICLVFYEKLPVNMHRASMKLREYLAMKKSVVANNVGEISDFRKYIYLSGPAHKAFKNELAARMIKNLDKRGEKGYKLIIEKYEWKKEIKKFITHLKQV